MVVSAGGQRGGPDLELRLPAPTKLRCSSTEASQGGTSENQAAAYGSLFFYFSILTKKFNLLKCLGT